MKIWSLQSLRFFAALAVVFYHASCAMFSATQHFGRLGRDAALVGQVGVDIFFVLSGVVIATSAPGLSAGAFAAKRASRILPLYGAIAAVYLTAALFAGTLGWRQAVTTLTLWPALDRMTDPVVPVAWTLCFEALFYAATALVLWRRRLLWPLLAVFAAALVLQPGVVGRFVGNPLILEFLMGVALVRAPKTRAAIVLIPVGVAMVCLLAPSGYVMTTGALNGEMAWSRVLYLGLPAAMVVWGTLQLKARPGLLTYLGDTSYALYLIHAPVVLSVVWLMTRWTQAPHDVVVLIAVVASVIVGWRVHELVEKPLLAWARRPNLFGKAAPLATPAA